MSGALELSRVRVGLSGRPVLSGLDLGVDLGEIRALVGLNGSGKTTALRVALGMLVPDVGTVRVLGEDVLTSGSQVWARVGHLIETPFSYPELTVRENLCAAADLHGADRRSSGVRIDELAEIMGLTPWLHRRAAGLSLGTRQKVGVVAALAHDPDLVVLDEPTNGLDPLAVVGLRQVLRQLAAEGRAVLVTSHHFDELARLAERVDVLHGGRLVGSLGPADGDLEQRFFAIVVAAERELQESR